MSEKTAFRGSHSAEDAAKRPAPVMTREHKCKRLQGKTALVTAGTLGIGRAIVERLLEEGASVFFCSRKGGVVDKVVAELRAKGFPNVGGCACHVGKLEQQTAFVEQGLKFFGVQRIDILVSNAATNPKAGPTLELSDEIYDKIMNTNVKSFFQLVKLTRPHMVRGGSIIFISSVGGHRPEPPLGIYGMSKTADIALARVLSVDLGSAGIRVNSICPGIIKTRMSSMLWTTTDAKTERASCSLQRYGDPADVAGVAAFLASDDAAFMTGESLIVSGGTGSRL